MLLYYIFDNFTGKMDGIRIHDIAVFGERKLLYKFGMVQAIKYNPCMKWQVPYLRVLNKVHCFLLWVDKEGLRYVVHVGTLFKQPWKLQI